MARIIEDQIEIAGALALSPFQQAQAKQRRRTRWNLFDYGDAIGSRCREFHDATGFGNLMNESNQRERKHISFYCRWVGFRVRHLPSSTTIACCHAVPTGFDPIRREPAGSANGWHRI
jgi:hypothetical protein